MAKPRLLTLVTITLLSCGERVLPEVQSCSCNVGETCHQSECVQSCYERIPHVLFVVDRSNSMMVIDPNNSRLSAIVDVIESHPNASFGVVSFADTVEVHTDFTTDQDLALSAVAQLAPTASNRRYGLALQTAHDLVLASAARLSEAERLRALYQVVFIADGFPFPDQCVGEANSIANAVDSVEALELAAVTEAVVAFELHTVFLSDPSMYDLNLNATEACCLGIDEQPLELTASCSSGDQSLGDIVESLLREMANAGYGRFLHFDREEVDLSDLQLAPSVSHCERGTCDVTQGLCLEE